MNYFKLSFYSNVDCITYYTHIKTNLNEDEFIDYLKHLDDQIQVFRETIDKLEKAKVSASVIDTLHEANKKLYISTTSECLFRPKEIIDGLISIEAVSPPSYIDWTEEEKGHYVEVDKFYQLSYTNYRDSKGNVIIKSYRDIDEVAYKIKTMVHQVSELEKSVNLLKANMLPAKFQFGDMSSAHADAVECIEKKIATMMIGGHLSVQNLARMTYAIDRFTMLKYVEIIVNDD